MFKTQRDWRLVQSNQGNLFLNPMIHVPTYPSLPTACVLPPAVYLATVVSLTIPVKKPGRNTSERGGEMGYNLNLRNSSIRPFSFTHADLEVRFFKVKNLNLAT